MILSRRQSLAAIGSTLLLAGCGQGRGGPLLRIGSQRGGTKALLLASGVLDGMPYQIEWSEFPAAQNLLEAIGSGAVDVGLVGDAPFTFGYQSGLPIKVVAAQISDPRPPEQLAIVVTGGSPIGTLADLKGKKVACTRGSIGHYLVLRALEKQGLPPDHVNLTWLAPGDAKAALESGAIDAWSTWVPYLSAAVAGGARVVFDATGIERQHNFEAANETAIAERRDLLRDFKDREARALRWANDNLDRYAQVLADDTGLPLPIARTTVEKNNRTPEPIDEALIADQRRVLETFVKAGAIEARRPVEEGFVREV